VMKLYDENRISIYSRLSDYLPELDSTNKRDIALLDIMAHRAGLQSWISFYEQTISKSRKNPLPSSKYYTKTSSELNPVPVTDKLFMRGDYMDEIKKRVYLSELFSTGKYKYSDLGFYIISDLVKKLTRMSID